MSKTILFTINSQKEVPELSNIDIGNPEYFYDYITGESEIIKFSLPTDIVRSLIQNNNGHFDKFHLVYKFIPTGADNEGEVTKDFMYPEMIMYGTPNKENKVDTYWRYKLSNSTPLFTM